jgi:hypothetical protein
VISDQPDMGGAMHLAKPSRMSISRPMSSQTGRDLRSALLLTLSSHEVGDKEANASR